MSPRNPTEDDLKRLVANRDRDYVETVRGGVVGTRTGHGKPALRTTIGSRTSAGGAGDLVDGTRLVQHPLAGSNPANAPITIALTGQIPSGKNQVQLLWRNGKVHRYPNKTFSNWRAKASIEILEQYGNGPTLTRHVCLTCNYWPGDAKTRDVSGQLDAIFSLLVYAKVLKNDGLVYSVWWRRHAMNRQFPKLVMDLEAWYE